MGNRVEEVDDPVSVELPTETGQEPETEVEPEKVPENGAKMADEKKKIIIPEPEKFIPPLNFSGLPEPSQAASPLKMKYEGRDKGRQRKFYETIDLLEVYHAGDARRWNKLDEQMQRYYRREYPEYFGRDSKAKQQARQDNKVKAARIRHERFQREARTPPKIPGIRVEPIDLQSRRKQVSSG